MGNRYETIISLIKETRGKVNNNLKKTILTMYLESMNLVYDYSQYLKNDNELDDITETILDNINTVLANHKLAISIHCVECEKIKRLLNQYAFNNMMGDEILNELAFNNMYQAVLDRLDLEYKDKCRDRRIVEAFELLKNGLKDGIYNDDTLEMMRRVLLHHLPVLAGIKRRDSSYKDVTRDYARKCINTIDKGSFTRK